MKSSVGQDGVSPNCDVHIEFNIVLSGDIGDMAQYLFSSLASTEFLGVGVHDWGGHASRGCWVQLESLVHHLYGLRDTFLAQTGNCSLKTALTYKAPWANNVGPNFHSHR